MNKIGAEQYAKHVHSKILAVAVLLHGVVNAAV